MWSLTSLRTKRMSSFRKFRLLPPKDFFDSIGQNAKYSQRADDFRLAPMNGHHQAQTPRPKSANCGHQHQVSYCRNKNCALNWLMIGKTTSPVRIALGPFGRDDFDRLISWLPTEDDLVAWCAGFFRYPLTHAQLER